MVITRVSDPYSFDTDPDQDPAFEAEYRSGSRALMPKAGKNLQLAIYLSLGLHK
jgi:hypothetical protein